MKAGRYDQKLTFRSFQNVDDGYGGTTPIWDDEITTFARVKTYKASSVTEAGQIVLALFYEIGIQWRTSFAPNETQRILYKGKDLQIKSVQENNERQHREYIITAVTVD